MDGAQHFSELLNQATDVDLGIPDYIEQNPINEKLDDFITMEEVEKASNNTKVKESSGHDGIMPEVLVYSGNDLCSFLLAIFNCIWMTKLMPSNYTDANICILFKKGNRSQCGNYRDTSLLSLVGKLREDASRRRLQCIVEGVYVL